jgi:hypothetical protein
MVESRKDLDGGGIVTACKARPLQEGYEYALFSSPVQGLPESVALIKWAVVYRAQPSASDRAIKEKFKLRH